MAPPLVNPSGTVSYTFPVAFPATPPVAGPTIPLQTYASIGQPQPIGIQMRQYTEDWLEILNYSDSIIVPQFDNGPPLPAIPIGWAWCTPVPNGATALKTTIISQTTTQQFNQEFLLASYYQAALIRAGFVPRVGPLNPNPAGGAGLVFNVMAYGATGKGVVDDTTAVQRAIAACLAAGGGIVWFPPGTYLISSTLIIQSNMVFAGAGRGGGTGAGGISILKAAANMAGGPGGAVGDLIAMPIPPTVGTSGFTQIGAEIHDLTLQLTGMGTSNLTGFVTGYGNGIHYYGAQWCQIKNVYVNGAPNYAIVLDGASPNSSFNCELRNIVTDTGAGSIYCASEATNLIGNVLKWAGGTLASAQPVFTGPITDGHQLNLPSGGMYVAGNVLGGGGNQANGGVGLPAIKVSNNLMNKIIGNHFDNPKYQAISLNSDNHVFAYNLLINPGAAGTGVPGIQIGSNHNVIIGNRVQGTGTQYNFPIREQGGPFAGNVIEGNELVAGSAAGPLIQQNAASMNYIRNNSGFNPVGNVGPPTIPASGTPLTNQTGVDVTVIVVTLGTLTAVAVAGVAVAGTPAVGTAYHLPCNQTITLTYAGAAPTWQWFGD